MLTKADQGGGGWRDLPASLPFFSEAQSGNPWVCQCLLVESESQGWIITPLRWPVSPLPSRPWPVSTSLESSPPCPAWPSASENSNAKTFAEIKPLSLCFVGSNLKLAQNMQSFVSSWITFGKHMNSTFWLIRYYWEFNDDVRITG